MPGHTAAVRRRYVLWPRIDQKTCLKAVVSAGLEAMPLALTAAGDELRTDVAALEAELKRLGPASVVAVVTTTSCFAPRAADDIVAVRHSITVCAEACGLVGQLGQFTQALGNATSFMLLCDGVTVVVCCQEIPAFGIVHVEF